MNRQNSASRPYDIAIPAPMLAKVVERRRSPDGFPHEVKEVRRGGVPVYQYPFAKMELGDFFIVAIGSRSEKSMRIAFYQSAARHDLEIAITPWKMPGGFPGLRVCVTIIGVTTYKIAAEKHGVYSRYSDGKWSARKREWSKERKKNGPRKKTGHRKSKPAASSDDFTLPFERAIAEAGPPPEERPMSRAEIIARALRQDSSS